MKKILFVATVYTHLANFHKPFIKYFQNKGFEVHAIANSNEGRKQEIEELGVVCWDVNFPRSTFNKNILKADKQVKKILRDNYYELIHVNTPIASFIVRKNVKNFPQGKIIYTAHGFHFFKGAPLKNWLFYYTAEYIAKKWTDGLIVMNDEDYNYGKTLGFIPDKTLFKVNGVGVDLYNFNPNVETNFRKELNISPNDIMITCIAELIPRKNQIFLLNIWNKIQENNKNVHLVFVGTGKDEKKLKEYTAIHKLNNIHFMGFRRDIPQIISSTDIITLVSKHEGLPKCLMEAMANGKPAIVSNVRGSKDIIRHNVNGYSFELNDIRLAIEYFTRLIENKLLRESIGKRNREDIMNYSIENVLKQYQNIYSKYLDLS